MTSKHDIINISKNGRKQKVAESQGLQDWNSYIKQLYLEFHDKEDGPKS